MNSLREWRITNLYTRGAGALGRDDLLEGVEEEVLPPGLALYLSQQEGKIVLDI